MCARLARGRCAAAYIAACIITGITALITAGAHAETLVEDVLDDRYYQIEVVIFSHQSAPPATEEQLHVGRRLSTDPTTLRQFTNWPYGPARLFESNTAVDIDEALAELEEQISGDSAAEAADDIMEPDPLTSDRDLLPDPVQDTPTETIPPLPSDRPPTAEERKARALAFARQELATAIGALEQQLAERSLLFEPAEDLGDFRLDNARARLQRRRGTEVLLAGRWLESPRGRNAPEPIWLQVGTPPMDDDGALLGNQALGVDAPVNVDEPSTGTLEGTLSVTLGRYLHFEANLAYDDPMAPTTAPPPGLTDPLPSDAALGLGMATSRDGTSGQDLADLRAPLTAGSGARPPFNSENSEPVRPSGMDAMSLANATEDGIDSYPSADRLVRFAVRRRMRSTELHYLDHPRLGILVRIDPVPVDTATAAALAQLKTLEAS